MMTGSCYDSIFCGMLSARETAFVGMRGQRPIATACTIVSPLPSPPTSYRPSFPFHHIWRAVRACNGCCSGQVSFKEALMECCDSGGSLDVFFFGLLNERREFR